MLPLRGMPLAGTDSDLSATIKAALLSDPNVRDNESLDQLCDAIASSVVTHIVANALVNIPATGAVGAPSVGVLK